MAGGWLELAVEADNEAVEAVTEVFSRFGYGEGVAIDQPFDQEKDGDNLQIAIDRPFTVRTYVWLGWMVHGRRWRHWKRRCGTWGGCATSAR